jgi:hypothetical protein
MPEATSLFRGFDNNVPAVFDKGNSESICEDDRFQQPNTDISAQNNAEEEVGVLSDDMDCDADYQPTSDEEDNEEVNKGVRIGNNDANGNSQAPNEDMDIEMDNNTKSSLKCGNNPAKDDIVETIIILPDTPSSFYDSPRTPVLVPDSARPKPIGIPEPSPTIYPKADIFPDDRSQEIANLFDGAMEIYYMRDMIMMSMRCWLPYDNC